MLFTLLPLIFGLLASFFGSSNGSVSVETASGTVIGFEQAMRNSSTIYTFYGIPYAEPPVGPLRFRFPQAVTAWTVPLQASKLPNSCVQDVQKATNGFPVSGVEGMNPNTPIEEDCLYLNVWTPDVSPSASLPILIWIHGGGLTAGSSTLKLYDGSILAATQRVVVASMQYRLGAFGFLYLGNEAAPGNMGLKDQDLAIQWIHKNARSFGGDPTKITLFGESAGGMSVSFHLVMNYGRPVQYFRSAILQSPRTLEVSSYVDPQVVLSATREKLSCIGCTIGNAVTCLQTANRSVINSCLRGYSPVTTDFHGLLPDNPRKLMDAGKFVKIPLIIGVCRNEGSIFIVNSFPRLINYTLPRDALPYEYAQKFLTDVMSSVGTPDAMTVQLALNQTYLADSSPNPIIDPHLRAIEEIWSDHDYKCSSLEIGRYYSAAGLPVFLYEFRQRPSSSPWPAWMGVKHGDELPYVFGMIGPKGTDAERALSSIMQTSWANFAKFGDACVNPILHWPVFSEKTDEQYVILDGQSSATKFEVASQFKRESCQLLLKYMKSSLYCKYLSCIDTKAVTRVVASSTSASRPSSLALAVALVISFTSSIAVSASFCAAR